MTFTKETTKEIRNWLKENDFQVGCRIGKTMSYDPFDNIIYVGKKYITDNDTDFMNFLIGLGLTNDFDTVTLSILHELGHCMTVDNFTVEEWAKNILMVNDIQEIENDHERNFTYWNTPVEYAANEFVVWLVNEHSEIVEELEEIIDRYFVY